MGGGGQMQPDGQQHTCVNGEFDAQKEGGEERDHQHGRIVPGSPDGACNVSFADHVEGHHDEHAGQSGYGQLGRQWRRQHNCGGYGDGGNDAAYRSFGAGPEVDRRAGERPAAGISAEQGGADIGQSLADKFLVQVDPLACLLGDGFGDGHCFDQAEDGDRQRPRRQLADVGQGIRRGCLERRQVPRDRAHHRNTAVIQVHEGHQRPDQDHGHEGPRPGRPVFAHCCHHQDGDQSQGQGNGFGLVQTGERAQQGVMESSGIVEPDTQQAGKLLESDQGGRAGGKSDQNGMGNKVEQRAEPGKAHGHLDTAHQQRQDASQFQIGDTLRWGQGTENTEDHEGNGGGGAGDQVGRAAPQAGDDGGHDGGVKAVLNGQPGNQGIGHGLGYGHNGHGQTGQQVGF